MFISKKELANRREFTAGERFILPVTDRVLALSTPNSSRACNVVKALQTSVPGVYSVALGAFRGAFNIGMLRYHFVIDSKAMKLNALFDQRGRKAVGPYRVRIEIIRVGIVRQLGTRASRGLPPKELHSSRPHEQGECRRRYHQVAASNLE